MIWKITFKNLFLILSIQLLLFGSTQLFAQVNPDDLAYDTDVSRKGTSAGSMLEIGVGARAEALGGAFVAIADDPSALYWNPAGIANMKSISLQATKTEWFVGTSFNVLDLVIPMPSMSSSLGFHLSMLDYGENPVRTVSRPEGTGEVYDASDIAIGLYWSMAITDRVAVGLGAKYFQQSIWHVKGSTMAADLSILFQTPVKGLRLGGAISNLGPEFALTGRDLTRIADVDGRKDIYFDNDNMAIELATEKYPLPLLFRFGVSYEWELDSRNSLLIASNVNHPSNDVESADFGLEAKLLNMFYLRSGYQSLFAEDSEAGITVGAGMKYKILGAAVITIDYAWSDWSALASTNRFTVGISSYY